MKTFQWDEIFNAYDHAKQGGQALHLHSFNQGHALFKRYSEIAHLFDQDRDRLIATARKLGVRVIKIEREGTDKQHIDLCGKPLVKAKSMASMESQTMLVCANESN